MHRLTIIAVLLHSSFLFADISHRLLGDYELLELDRAERNCGSDLSILSEDKNLIFRGIEYGFKDLIFAGVNQAKTFANVELLTFIESRTTFDGHVLKTESRLCSGAIAAALGRCLTFDDFQLEKEAIMEEGQLLINFYHFHTNEIESSCLYKKL